MVIILVIPTSLKGERSIEGSGTSSLGFSIIIGVGSMTYTARGQVVIISDKDVEFFLFRCQRVSSNVKSMALLMMGGFC